MGTRVNTPIPWWCWAVFAAIAVGLLAVDLAMNRGTRVESRKKILAWAVVWVAVGVLFSGFVWIALGGRRAHEYLATFAMEASLSLDNLFMFLVIFQKLGVSKVHQHKVLFWGILGAIVFRGVFIFLGVAALRRWEWLSYIFGVILFYAAYHAFRAHPAKEHESRIVEWLSRHLPVTQRAPAGEFIFSENGQRRVTLLFLALLAIELTDVMFASDSVPAALAITRDEFIVYSSNIFAILGLRAFYLLLARTITHLRYLHYGLAAVLTFAGLKMIADEWVEIPPSASVGVVVALIGVSVWTSVGTGRNSPKLHRES